MLISHESNAVCSLKCQNESGNIDRKEELIERDHNSTGRNNHLQLSTTYIEPRRLDVSIPSQVQLSLPPSSPIQLNLCLPGQGSYSSREHRVTRRNHNQPHEPAYSDTECSQSDLRNWEYQSVVQLALALAL
jgi:hypothetical protein